MNKDIKTGRFSKEEDEYIIDNFNTCTVQEIADHLGRLHKSVEDRTRKLKLVKAEKILWTKEETDRLVEFYNKTPEVFNMFPGRSRSSISYKAHSLGLKKYNRGEFAVDYDYFKTWNPNMAYIFGFIAADGNISIEPKILNITQSIKDYYILNKMKNEFKSKRDIHVQPNKICHLVIRCGEMVDDLIKLGIEPCKSLTMKWFTTIPDAYLNHFIRGYLDGDGCVCTYTRKCRGTVLEVSFLGTRDFLEGMSKEISRMVGIKIIKVFDITNNKIKRMKYSGNTAVKLLNWLYQDNPEMYLIRKRNKFIEYLKQDNSSNVKH